MDKFRKTFSLRKKKRKSNSAEMSKPKEWLDDEKKIKDVCCNFQVKYLGCIEVFESRGMQVCEEAIRALRKSKKKSQKAILYISGDTLRVSDEISKHLIVDQTIEKVSFCAPDRTIDKGFAYICRDGATRRWMCHAFLASKESGERLSHAVGCAFAICLEKKQKREHDALQTCTTDDNSPLPRMSSFRQTTLSERLLDPQSAILVESCEAKSNEGQTPEERSQTVAPSSITMRSASPLIGGGSDAIPRPRASASLIDRQGSLRVFPKLQETSPFKQNISLRLGELPSNLRRLQRIINNETIPEEGVNMARTNFALPPVTLPEGNGLGSSMKATESPVDFSSPEPKLQPRLETLTALAPDNGASISNFKSTGDDGHLSGGDPIVESTGTNSPPNTVDPFSAAPFNPETIQQHHKQQLQAQLPAVSQNVLSVFSRTSPLCQASAPSYLVMNSPINASASYGMALFCTPAADSPLVSPKTSATSHQHLTAHDGALSIDPSGSHSGSWLPVRPPLLPPEPDRFADPFDLSWADQATARVRGQLSSTLPPLPLTASIRNPFYNVPSTLDC